MLNNGRFSETPDLTPLCYFYLSPDGQHRWAQPQAQCPEGLPAALRPPIRSPGQQNGPTAGGATSALPAPQKPKAAAPGGLWGQTRGDTAPAPSPSPSPSLPLPSQRPARQGRAAASAPLLRMPTHPPAHAPCTASLHSKGGLILPARFFLLQPDCGLRDVAVPGAAAAPVEAARSCPPPHLRAPRRTARTHLQPPPAARRPALAHPPAAAPSADWLLPVSFSAVAPSEWLGGLPIRIKPRPPSARALASPPSLLLSDQPVVGPFPCHSRLF